MRFKFFISIVLIVSCNYYLSAQDYQLGGGISNNVTSFPVTGYPQLFYSGFHPGIDIILEKKLNTKLKNQWWTEANLGCFYHRFFQTALKLNVNFHYRYHFKPHIFSDIAIGGGYLHSFYHYQVFKLNSNGDYVKESGYKGRPQFIAGICMGAGISLKKSDPELWKLLIQFRTSAQGIFAGSFVPVVPYNTFLLGLTHHFNFTKKKNATNNEK